MPKNGHLTWKAIYQPGKVVAVGYLSHTGICKAMKDRKLPSLLIVIATKLN